MLVPPPPAGQPAALRTGIDLVQVSRIRESLQHFGERFCRRLFTPAEQAYAAACPAQQAQRLAARFAAKEAALKALDLADAGVPWTQLEVQRQANGACRLALHGRAAELVAARGPYQTALSLSHEADYASAVVLLWQPAGSSEMA